MKNIFLVVLVGLAMLVFLPEAKAQRRMGMAMARPQRTMGFNMGNRTSFTMGNRVGMQARFVPPGSNGGVITPGRFDRFEDRFGRFDRRFDRLWWPGRRWWGWPGGVWLDFGGYGGLDGLYPDWSAPAGSSQQTTRRQRPRQEEPPALTPAQERERVHQEELAWSRSNLPDNETTSATALNILLADLQNLQARGIQGPDVTIDQAILPSLNVVVAGRSGNIGVIKHEGRITWPAPLSGADFEAERKHIESAIPKAIDQAVNGKSVDLRDLTAALTSIRARLADKIQETPTAQYIRAQRQLNELDDAVRLLRQSDAGKYFDHTYAAKGQTAAQLVQHMTEHGLQFAPAMEGDEPAYAALHQALVKYDLAANAENAAKKP